MRTSPGLLAALGMIAVVGWGSPAAWATVSGIGAGVSIQAPMGDVYQSLGRATGFQLDLSWAEPSLGPDWDIHLDGSYHGYDVTGLTGGKIHFVGVFGGVQTARRGSKMTPYFGLEIGGVYDGLTLQGGSSQSNAGFAFATKLTPGFDVPVYDKLSIGVELPVTFAFFKTALATWSGVIGARWML